jgi:hypothetical protein
MKEKPNKEWEYKNSPLSKGVFDYVNEDLDSDIEEIGVVIRKITNKLGDKANVPPDKHKKYKLITKGLNSIILLFYHQKLTKKQALDALRYLIIKNPKYSHKIKIINLSELSKLKEFINLKNQAIENKEFEKAAKYRDLAIDYDLYKQIESKFSEYETDAYFAYWVDVLYFVIKEEDPFNREVLSIISPQ